MVITSCRLMSDEQTPAIVDYIIPGHGSRTCKRFVSFPRAGSTGLFFQQSEPISSAYKVE